MIGAAAMSLSSFCVVTNALRLNFFKMFDGSRDRPRRKKAAQENPAERKIAADQEPADRNNTEHNTANNTKGKEEKTMTKTLEVKGMMCQHCEARVKKALEALEQVEAAEVSHEAGTAVVTLKEDVENDVLKQAVEAQDYEVLAVR